MFKNILYRIQDVLYVFFIHLENGVTRIRLSLGKASDYNRIDKEYNIDTQTIPNSTYIPISTKVFKMIMNNIEQKDEIKFLDYGSGKGKALILASEMGIKDITGIEFNEELVELSKKNLDSYRSKQHTSSKFNVIYGDATKFREIDQYNLFFVNNSFGGNPSEERLVAKIFKNIEDSLERNPRHVNLVYVHPSISLQKLFDTYSFLSHQKVVMNTYRPKIDNAYIYIFSMN